MKEILQVKQQMKQQRGYWVPLLTAILFVVLFLVLLVTWQVWHDAKTKQAVNSTPDTPQHMTHIDPNDFHTA